MKKNKKSKTGNKYKKLMSMIDCNNTSSHLDKFVNAQALKRNPVNGLETSNIVSKKIERENRRTLTESVDDRVPRTIA